MKQFYTVVLERMARFTKSFDTEPYECGWAGEALFFVRVHDLEGKGAALKPRVQISADGIEWIDEGTAFPELKGRGNYAVKVSRFGGWLRLAFDAAGERIDVKLTIHLVLKE